jgi:hypothetical protein
VLLPIPKRSEILECDRPSWNRDIIYLHFIKIGYWCHVRNCLNEVWQWQIFRCQFQKSIIMTIKHGLHPFFFELTWKWRPKFRGRDSMSYWQHGCHWKRHIIWVIIIHMNVMKRCFVTSLHFTKQQNFTQEISEMLLTILSSNFNIRSRKNRFLFCKWHPHRSSIVGCIPKQPSKYRLFRGYSHESTSLTFIQPTLHYRHHGFCNVNVIWVAC